MSFDLCTVRRAKRVGIRILKDSYSIRDYLNECWGNEGVGVSGMTHFEDVVLVAANDPHFFA